MLHVLLLRWRHTPLCVARVKLVYFEVSVLYLLLCLRVCCHVYSSRPIASENDNFQIAIPVVGKFCRHVVFVERRIRVTQSVWLTAEWDPTIVTSHWVLPLEAETGKKECGERELHSKQERVSQYNKTTGDALPTDGATTRVPPLLQIMYQSPTSVADTRHGSSTHLCHHHGSAPQPCRT